MRGLAGKDTIRAERGNDRLVGGGGNDRLLGSTGNDLYVFAGGWGNDTIASDTSGQDTVDFRGVSASGVTFTPLDSPDVGNNYDDLSIALGGGNVVLIKNYFDNSAPRVKTSGAGTGLVENIRFSDGTFHFDDVQNLINDKPTISNIANQTIDEDGNTGALAFTIGDAESAVDTLTLTGSSSDTTLVPNSNIVFGGSDANRTVTVSPAADKFGTATIEVKVEDPDGGSSTDTFELTVNSVNDAPVADDESFNGNSGAIGNTTLIVNDPDDGAPNPSHPKKTITGDILAGDTDVDGSLTVMPGTFATNDGGSVTIESDGDFTFNPAVSTSCTDTSDFFDYTVKDSGSPEQTDSGRVTISIAGCVWYVSNNASGNNGTSSAPFDTLAQAETASGANHTVFVFDGDNTSTGYNPGYAMNSGERLIGEHEGLVIDPDGGGPLTADTLHPANPGAHPTLTAANEDVVHLDDGNEVRGFNVDPQGTGGGIAGGAGDIDGTIDNVNVADTGPAGTQPGLELDGTSGTFNVSNLDVDTVGATGVRLNNAGTVGFASAGTISITTSGTRALDAAGTNMGSSVLDDITVTASTGGGLSMSNTTGSATLGDGTGTDLALTTISGGAAALSLANAGNVTVDGAGTDNLSATGGPALDVTGTSGATLEFDDADSTNSATDGIRLDNTTGTVTAHGGSLVDATDQDVDITGNGSGDNVTFTFSGAINDDIGQLVRISDQTGGTKRFLGPISDGNDGDGSGISLSNNIGTTIRFDGGLTLSTGANPAFAATGGGTLFVTDPAGAAGNAIATGTGTALNVSNTTIGLGASDDLTFERISSNGAGRGILLNNTGSNGGLTVTGSGGTCTNADTSGCSGGVIANGTGADDSSATPTGTGIVLNNTRDVSLTRMRIHDHSNYAIRGTSVNGFALANSVINGTNGNNGTTPFDDSSVRFDNLTGNAQLSTAHISGGHENNVDVNNTSGTLNRLTLSNATVGANSTAGGNDGVQIEGAGSANVNVTVEDSAFTSAAGDLFQFSQPGTGTGDLDFLDNTLSNNHPAIATGGGGVTLSSGSTSNVDMNVAGNTFRDAKGHAVLIVKDIGGGSLQTTFNDNDIGLQAVANSGSLEGAGLKVQQAGQGTMTTQITNNQIRQYNNEGILLQAGAGIAHGGNFNTNISGNTVANPGTNPNIGNVFQGIHVNSGTTPGDTFATCVNFGANTVNNSGRNGGVDVRVRQRQSTTFRLPGYADGPTNTTAVNSFIAGKIGNNPSVSSLAESSGFTGSGTTCP